MILPDKALHSTRCTGGCILTLGLKKKGNIFYKGQDSAVA